MSKLAWGVTGGTTPQPMAHQCANVTGLGARGSGKHNAALVGISKAATFGNGRAPVSAEFLAASICALGC